jgi:hypothetical protein
MGGPAASPFLDVVAVGAMSQGPAARMRAGPIPDLGTPPQRPAGAARTTLIVSDRSGVAVPSPSTVPFSIAFIVVVGLAGQIGGHLRPVAKP